MPMKVILLSCGCTIVQPVDVTDIVTSVRVEPTGMVIPGPMLVATIVSRWNAIGIVVASV